MTKQIKKPDKWAKYIADLLEQNQCTQAKFAKYCGVSRACVNLWLSANRRPRIDALQKIIGAVARVTGQTRAEATKAVCKAYLFDYGVM